MKQEEPFQEDARVHKWQIHGTPEVLWLSSEDTMTAEIHDVLIENKKANYGTVF